MAVVTLYRDNKLALAEKHDPDELAREFIATLKGDENPGYKTSGRLNVEFEYRWFLAGFGGPHGFSWNESVWPVLWGALMDYTAEDPEADQAMIRGLG